MSEFNILNLQEKLDLNNLIKANEVVDYTEEIRYKKQSELIRNDVKQMIYLKNKNKLKEENNDKEELDNLLIKECKFLFNNYTDIFNKIKNDIIDIKILMNFLDILKKIEEGEIDQHEGSYLVGKYLKEMYVDSVLKQKSKIEEEDIRNERKKKFKNELIERNICYKDYKILTKK